jgi:hypothetical protein
LYLFLFTFLDIPRPRQKPERLHNGSRKTFLSNSCAVATVIISPPVRAKTTHCTLASCCNRLGDFIKARLEDGLIGLFCSGCSSSCLRSDYPRGDPDGNGKVLRKHSPD